MRATVYIPDELLEQAKRLVEDSDNTSRLVQRGLERLVEEQTQAPAYAQKPVRSLDRIAQLRDRLLAEASADYERGYAIAIEAASRMPLHAVNALVDHSFDLKKWLDPWKRGLSSDLIQHAEPMAREDAERVVADLKESAGRRRTRPSDDKRHEDQWWWLWKTAEALGEFADPTGFDEYCFVPTQARQRGYADAMRDLWSALEQPDWTSSPEPPSSEDAKKGGDGTPGRRQRGERERP